MADRLTRVGRYVSNNTNTVLKLAGAAAAIGGGLYIVYQVAQYFTGPQGGSCSTPGTPCYTATQPIISEYNQCASQYFSNLNSFIAADSAAGTGFTQLQLSTLSQLRSCMDTALTNLGKTANQYVPTQTLNYIAYAIAATGIGLASVYGASSIYKAWRLSQIQVRTAASEAARINNTLITSAARQGAISGTSASDFASDVGGYTSSFATEDATTLESVYVTAGITDIEEATSLAASDLVALDADAAAVEDTLAGFAGYPPGLATYTPMKQGCSGCPYASQCTGCGGTRNYNQPLVVRAV